MLKVPHHIVSELLVLLHQWASVKELQWFCERLDFKRVVDKRKLLYEGVNKVTECCLADMLCIVYLLTGICSVVL